MRKAIILEGPDNVGKSRLAREIVKRFARKEPIIRHSKAPVSDNKLQEVLKALKKDTLRLYNNDNGLEIWDRSVIGEAVYGPMYRSTEYDPLKYWVALRPRMHEVRKQVFVVVLYTNGDIFTTWKIKPKGDEKNAYQKRGAAQKISTEFVNVVTELNVPNVLLINCENYDSFKSRNAYILKRLDYWLQSRAFDHRKTDDLTHTFFSSDRTLWHPDYGLLDSGGFACDSYVQETCELGGDHASISMFGQKYGRPTSGCGNICNPKFVFVGEAPGQKGCGKTGVPFYDDISGNLLQDALDRNGILPTQYYLTNVVKCCPAENDLKGYVNDNTRRNLECVKGLEDEIRSVMTTDVKGRKIIAIGKVASFELARLGVDHITLYHPAYHARIGDIDGWFKSFREAVQ